MTGDPEDMAIRKILVMRIPDADKVRIIALLVRSYFYPPDRAVDEARALEVTLAQAERIRKGWDDEVERLRAESLDDNV